MRILILGFVSPGPSSVGWPGLRGGDQEEFEDLASLLPLATSLSGSRTLYFEGPGHIGALLKWRTHV